MMKNIILRLFSAILIFSIWYGASSFIQEPSAHYKCMIQMTNYSGEKAYVVVSLISPEGKYIRTLYVQGNDEEWFPDLRKWWAFSDGSHEDIDAITGATIGNGERNIISLAFATAEIDNGYKLRFESAVEDQHYYEVDAEVALNSQTIAEKVEGQGYIRYIRMVPNK